MIDNLISGLVSGIIVVLLVLAFRAFWDHIVVPWFEERVYKDARIEGQWFSLYSTIEEHRQETITLTRHGHAVTGTMVCTSGSDEGEQYQISGSFRNLILPLVYETQSKSKTDRGTITLKLIANAQRFSGKLAAYHTPDDTVAATDVIWFRSKDDLNKVLKKLESRSTQIQKLREREQQIDAAKRQLTEAPETEKTAEGEKRTPPVSSSHPEPEEAVKVALTSR